MGLLIVAGVGAGFLIWRATKKRSEKNRQVDKLVSTLQRIEELS